MENENGKFYIREIEEQEYSMEKNEEEKFYIREIPEQEYSMAGRRNEITEQVNNMEIAGGKNEESPFREILKEVYRKMLNEKKNENEKFYIREIEEEKYMKMLDESKKII